MSATVALFALCIVCMTAGALALLFADPDRYIDEPDDVDPDLLPRRMDEWQTAVDNIRQNRGQ